MNRRVDRLVSELHVFDQPVDGSDVTTVVVYRVVEVAEGHAVEILPIDGPSVAIQNFGDFLLVSEGHGQAPVLPDDQSTCSSTPLVSLMKKTVTRVITAQKTKYPAGARELPVKLMR